MSSESERFCKDYIPVPKTLHSFETGKCFTHCVECGDYLLDDGTPYLIQKVFKGDEVLLEYAQCARCHQALLDALSKETMTAIWDFVLDSTNMDERAKSLSATAPLSLDGWTESCLTCGAKRHETASYAMIGQCDGPDLLFLYTPYMVCEGCQIKMSDLMSSASRDGWDKWIDENLDVPPSIKLDIKEGKIVFV